MSLSDFLNAWPAATPSKRRVGEYIYASAAANLQQELISQARAEVPKPVKTDRSAKADEPKMPTPPASKKGAAKAKRRASSA